MRIAYTSSKSEQDRSLALERRRFCFALGVPQVPGDAFLFLLHGLALRAKAVDLFVELGFIAGEETAQSFEALLPIHAGIAIARLRVAVGGVDDAAALLVATDGHAVVAAATDGAVALVALCCLPERCQCEFP